jgi:hypothetical protein
MKYGQQCTQVKASEDFQLLIWLRNSRLMRLPHSTSIWVFMTSPHVYRAAVVVSKMVTTMKKVNILFTLAAGIWSQHIMCTRAQYPRD